MVMGKTFSHKEALKAGYKCRQCHTEITRGDGVVPKEKCYFCHVERTEMYDDVQLIHEKHVGEKQVDCLWCHPRIEHGKISMAKNIPML
jgi:CRISPR/Cas system-associated protein Cas10 (large subunit of type III CRISPR-Cas system)